MKPDADFRPIKVMEVELSQPLPEITALDEAGKTIYQKAKVLVRLHSYPLGLVDIKFAGERISPVQLASECWTVMNTQINNHLVHDDMHPILSLPPSGLSSATQPACLIKQHEALKDAPLISVVIATRDRGSSLGKMMKSLIGQDYPKFEVILVDNAPRTAETYEYYNQNQKIFVEKGISLRYVREDTPGLAIAHNRGLELVAGEIVAFTDDDVVIDRQWLTEILRGFGLAKTIGCVTGLVIPAELETPAQVLFEEFGGFMKGFSPQLFEATEQEHSNRFFPFSPGRYGTGANMAFRTSALKKIGGFDPELGVGTPSLGADDLAIFFKVVMAGYQLMYQPSALVHHQHRRMYEGLRKQMFGYGTGLTAFITKCIIEKPLLTISLLPKIPAGIQIIFSPNSPKNVHKSSKYPKELELIERRGMLYGPIAYLYSRWTYRKLRRKDGSYFRGEAVPLPRSNLVG